MPKALLIEDDSVVSYTLKVQLENKGFEVTQVFNGSAAIRKVINIHPDIILLDIGLPNKNGYQICKELREFYSGGIIILTAQETPEAEIASFGLGADDFVNKSVPFEILYQRIKRLGIRPKEIDVSQTLKFDAIEFHPYRADCLYSETSIGLTQEEYELFYYIAMNKDHVLSRQKILKVLKGTDYDGVDRSIDIKVARIRSKLQNVGLPKNTILSIRSKGYRFNYPAS